MKAGLVFGSISILIGVALMMGGERMCRTSCWMDNLFRIFLPKGHESLAGGLPWVVMGVAIIIYAVWKRPRQ